MSNDTVRKVQPVVQNTIHHSSVYSNAYLRYALGLMFVIALFNYMDRFVLSILLDPIQKDTGLTDSQLGLLTGIAFAAVYSILSIPIGRLADRYNRVRIIAAAITIWSAFTALFGFAANYTQMIFARIGVAAGEAGGVNPVYSIVGDYFPAEKRGTALAVINLGGGLGTLFGYALAGFLNDAFGWRMTFIILGVCGVMLGPVILFTLREPQRGQTDGILIDETRKQETFIESVKELWTRRSYVMLVMGMAVAATGSMGVMIWLPTYLIRKFHMSTTEVGAWFAAGSALPYAASILIAGIVADRLYRKDPRWSFRLPAIGTAIAAPFILFLLFMPSVPLTILMGVVPNFCAGLLGPPLIAISQALAGSRFRSLSMAFMSFATYFLGMGIGPTLIGIISQFSLPYVNNDGVKSLGIAIGCASILYVLGALILYVGSKTVKQDIEKARDYDRQFEK